MNNKNLMKKEKKIALFEILILIIGIVAFAYFVGDEFKLVSASAGGAQASECTKSNPYFVYYACGASRTYTIINSNTITGIGCDSSGGNIQTHTYTKQTDGSWTWEDGTKVIEGNWITSADDCISQINAGTTTDSSTTQQEESSSTNPTDALKDAAIQEGTKKVIDESTKETTADGGKTAPAKTEKTGIEKFGENILSNVGALLINAGIAAGLYGATQLIKLIPGIDEDKVEMLGQALALGYGIGATLGIIISSIPGLEGSSLPILGVAGAGWGLIGLGIGLLSCLVGLFGMCKKTQIKAVVYTCYPWQPETGGADCEKCNTGQFPCTEYKCQSLGQGCELLNQGTDEQVCVWNNRNDISPPVISSWSDPLPEGYEYTPDSARLPPDKGVRIEYTGSEDGCIPPFSRLTYGISLDKPGICKIDTVRTDTFDDMSITISSGYYKYNHTLFSLHGGINETSEEGIEVPNGGIYEVYVRCQSRNGYSNEGTFVFKYCVSDEEDTTAPAIKLTDPLNEMPIAYGQTSIDVDVYVDKPSDCRWSHEDEDYDLMAETMTCASSISDVGANMFYKCSTTLTGLKDETENTFYFRCNSYPNHDIDDNPDTLRYKNEESYVYTLIGTRSLVINSVSPNGTIKDSTESVKVTLEAETSAGYDQGNARCYFKEASQSDSNYVLFANTDSYEHSQDLWLNSGGYRYSIRCCDLGGNCDVDEVEFEVETDFESPLIARAYNEENKLKVITNENAECVYDITDCSYSFDDGIKLTTADNLEHFTEWNINNNFYIKCEDEFGNQPAPDECSIIVRPFSSY